MNQSKGTHKILNADFSESLVAFELNKFFSILSFPLFQFSIESFTRQSFVDDQRISCFKPFYLQCKRPSFVPASSKSKVINERCALTLSATPGALYFQLDNNLKKNQAINQHDMLFKLRQRLKHANRGDAAYFCPTFLKQSQYYATESIEGLRSWFANKNNQVSHWRQQSIFTHNRYKQLLALEGVPLYPNHACISPHSPILNASNDQHYVSFTELTNDVCLHSSQDAIPLENNGTQSFSTFMVDIIDYQDHNYIKSDDAMSTLGNPP